MSFVLLDLRQMADFFASKLFKLALDSESLVDSILHELVYLKQFRVWIVSSTFIRAFLSKIKSLTLL